MYATKQSTTPQLEIISTQESTVLYIIPQKKAKPQDNASDLTINIGN